MPRKDESLTDQSATVAEVAARKRTVTFDDIPRVEFVPHANKWFAVYSSKMSGGARLSGMQEAVRNAKLVVADNMREALGEEGSGFDDVDLVLVAEAVREGANVNMIYRGKSPLMIAVSQQDEECVTEFLEAGADVNSVDGKDGSTPLHKAASLGIEDRVHWLIVHGAQFNLQDFKGRTPLHLATDHGHTRTAQLLVNHGANIRIKDHIERTAADLARARRNDDITDFLSGVP